MRIAVLSTLDSGGAAGAAWRITRALSDFGHECSFFILEGSGNPLRIPLLDNDDAFWLSPLFRHWSALTTPETLAANATELFSDALTAAHISYPLPAAIYEAEIIHLHWVAGMLFSPALLRVISGKKIVWTLHDTNAFTGGCHYSGLCQAFKSQCRDCPLLKRPSLDDASARNFNLKKQIYPLLNPSLVTPSGWLADEVKSSALLRNYPVTAIPNPLDMEKFQPPPNRTALRRKLDLPEDAFVILSGCEDLCNPRKNTKALFEALALLSAQTPDFAIVVMLYGHGQPPKLDFPIRHFGYLNDETVMTELYGAADLFIHTGLQDNLPLTLCEAQACGTPTICFAVGGCPETMLPGKTGFLVDETTSEALAEKLRAIITNRGNMAAMREAARAFAVERFNPRMAAAAYTEVFEKAQTVPGLKHSDPLFTDLLQNQIASLAYLFHDIHKEQTVQFDSRVVGLDSRVSGLDSRVVGLEALCAEQSKHIEALGQQLNMFRWNLRHPFRWFFRKLRAKLRGIAWPRLLSIVRLDRKTIFPELNHGGLLNQNSSDFGGERIMLSLPDTLPDGSPWPRISIITPSYNQGKYIEETILSVLEQNYPNIEHIVVDGMSTDNTLAILEKYRSRLAGIIREPDKGQSDAINKGMALATGDILTWLNSDDMLAPGALATVAMAFHVSRADIVAGSCRLYADGACFEEHMTGCRDAVIDLNMISDVDNEWLKGRFFYQPEVMFTRDIWRSAGGFVDPEQHFCMDAELWLRFAEHGARLHVISVPLARFRYHPEQKTSDVNRSPDEYRAICRVRRKTAGLPPVTAAAGLLYRSLRITMLNDVGGLYGAGKAHYRLAEAIKMAGHDISFVRLHDYDKVDYAAILKDVAAMKPDIVVIGNVHSWRADARLLNMVAEKYPVIFCAHDLWLITGKCPYPSIAGCIKHSIGCDAACPALTEYPPINADDVAEAWADKRKFADRSNVLILANSAWTKENIDMAFQDIRPKIDMLTLGCDPTIFRSLDKRICRSKFHLPMDAFIVMLSSVSLDDHRKGCLEGLQALKKSGIDNLHVACVGHFDKRLSEMYPGIQSLGYQEDQSVLAAAYSAADVVVSFSRAETFGQTLMEAGMCGTAAAAYDMTGMRDAVKDGISGVLCQPDPEALVETLRKMSNDRKWCADLGAWGGVYMSSHHSLLAIYRSFFLALEKAALFPPGFLSKKITYYPHIECVAFPTLSLRKRIRNLPFMRKTEHIWVPVWRFVKALRVT